MSPIEGTVNWLWSHSTYVKWTKAKSAVLWIQGKPGSGKSVLAKSIVDQQSSESSKSAAVPVVAHGKTFICDWYYNTRGGAKLMAHCSLMRSLLHQLLQQNPSAFEFVKRWYREVEPRSDQWAKLNVMQDILIEAAKSGLKVTCVIDAMDESQNGRRPGEDRLGILEHFSMLVSEISASQVKFIILSRPYPDIEEHFFCHRLLFDNLYSITLERENRAAILKVIDLGLLDLQHAMHPRAGATHGVLRRAAERGLYIQPSRYVQQPLSRREEQHLQKIREYLTANANGVILWVSLILSTLKSLVSSGIFTLLNLQDTLEALPIDLMDLYRHIIVSVIGDHDKNRLYLARKALMLVTGANIYDSLTISELHEALALPEDIARNNTDEIFEWIEDQKLPIIDGDWNEFRTRLRLLCGPLIEFIKAPSQVRSPDQETNEDEVDASDRVQLLHRTTKDVLADPGEAHELQFTEKGATDLVDRVMRNYRRIIFPEQSTSLLIDKVGLVHQTLGCCKDTMVLNVPSLVGFLDARTFLPFCIRNSQLASPVRSWSLFPRGDQKSANLQFLSEVLIDRFTLASKTSVRKASASSQLLVARTQGNPHDTKDIICSEYIESACRNGFCMAASLLLQVMFRSLREDIPTGVLLGSIIRGLPKIARQLQLTDEEKRLKSALLMIRSSHSDSELLGHEPLLDELVEEAKQIFRVKRPAMRPATRPAIHERICVEVVIGDQTVINGSPQLNKIKAAISEVLDFVSNECRVDLPTSSPGRSRRSSPARLEDFCLQRM
jgi:hypothetical protein